MGVTFGKAYIEQWKKENQGSVDAKKAEISQMKQMAAQIDMQKTAITMQTISQLTAMGIQFGTLIASKQSSGKGGAATGEDVSVEAKKTQVNEIYTKHQVSTLQELEAKVQDKKTELDNAKQKAETSEKAYNASVQNVEGYKKEVGASEAKITNLNSNLSAKEQDLKRYTESEPKNEQEQKLKEAAVQTLTNEIAAIKQEIEQEQKKIEDLNNKIAAEDLETKGAEAKADADAVTKLSSEFSALQNDYSTARSIEAQIQKEEGNIPKKNEELKNSNASRNEFDAAIKGQNLEKPTAEMKAAADKWIKENPEDSVSNPSQRAAYDICKKRAETIQKNYKEETIAKPEENKEPKKTESPKSERQFFQNGEDYDSIMFPKKRGFGV